MGVALRRRGRLRVKSGSSVTPRAANASAAPSPRSTRQSTRVTLPPASVTASSASSVEPPVVVVSSTSATVWPGAKAPSRRFPRPCFFASLRTKKPTSFARGIVVRRGREHRRDERHRADGHAADGVDPGPRP